MGELHFQFRKTPIRASSDEQFNWQSKGKVHTNSDYKRYTLTAIITGRQWPVTPEPKLVGPGVCLSPYLQS